MKIGAPFLSAVAIVNLTFWSLPLQGQVADMSSNQPSRASVSSQAGQNALINTTQPQPASRYTIKSQDVLSLTFPLSPELNQTVTVQPDGYINLQNVGGIYVQRLTVPEVVESVKRAYKDILHDPIINVDVQDFQKPFFVATGQLGKPGQYDLRSEITVAEAIAIAGGLNTGAKNNVYLFHRSSTDWYRVQKINMNHILNGKELGKDTLVQPGDMVYVPKKAIEHFREYVPYSFSLGTYLTPGGNL